MKKTLEHKLLDAIHKQNHKQVYDLYIWQQFRSGDDIWYLSMDYPLFDTVQDILTQQIEQQSGYIYIAEHPTNGYMKVGFTRTTPNKRIHSLNQAGVFDELVLLKAYKVHDIRIETLIHQELEASTPFVRKEFFKTSLSIIDNVINNHIQQFNQFLKELKLI